VAEPAARRALRRATPGDHRARALDRAARARPLGQLAPAAAHARERDARLRLHPQLGYPFTLGLEIAYTLSENGLEVALRARNLGAEAAPFGAGFHPCLTVGDTRIDDTRLELPARACLPVDDRLLPTGPPIPVDGAYDFRRLRPVGTLELDTCFAEPARGADGLARTRLLAGDGGRAVMLWMDAGFDYLHVYTGDAEPDPARRRRGITLEPMTCAPDAFNTGEGLRVLDPGAAFAGRWGLIG